MTDHDPSASDLFDVWRPEEEPVRSRRPRWTVAAVVVAVLLVTGGGGAVALDRVHIGLQAHSAGDQAARSVGSLSAPGSN